MNRDLKDIRILTLGHAYLGFVKDLAEVESKFVNQINVILHHNSLVEISNYVPFGGYFDHLKWYTKRRMIDLRGKPNNLKLHLISLLYFIPDGRNLKLGDKLFKVFSRYIKNNKFEFDLIHAHFIYPQGYVGVKIKEKFGVPLIVTTHEHDICDMPVRNRKWILEQADHIITVSQWSKDIVVEKLGIPKEHISVIPNGFAPRLFKQIDQNITREKLGLPQDKKIILNVGNPYPVKGHKYLIEAISNIIKEYDNILCIIVGDGSIKESLKKQTKRLNIEKYVTFVGARPHDEIPLWMNASDLFVFPSLRESFGVVQIEAMACGVPVVATRNGGSEEIITSEDYGLLCEPANPKDLEEKILIALEKDWDREKIRKYAEQFTWDDVAKETLKVYRMVLVNAKDI
ncbi:MAG: D-inositol 3-phosphate glycosyltransferase [candidate division WS2 bacterium]|nr:D-inositol 3-phosphate glycosyltransferase [Candidatus Psychracetigena formicireducens]